MFILAFCVFVLLFKIFVEVVTACMIAQFTWLPYSFAVTNRVASCTENNHSVTICLCRQLSIRGLMIMMIISWLHGKKITKRKSKQASSSVSAAVHWSLLFKGSASIMYMRDFVVERLCRAGQRERSRGRTALGVYSLSWLLSNNRLEQVPFVSVPHTSSNRLCERE